MTVVALFEEGCIGKALDYGEGGPVYNIVSPHIGGAPDAGNSLYAVDKLCFRERLVSFDELMAALAANWEGYEVLREYARKKLICYGKRRRGGRLHRPHSRRLCRYSLAAFQIGRDGRTAVPARRQHVRQTNRVARRPLRRSVRL